MLTQLQVYSPQVDVLGIPLRTGIVGAVDRIQIRDIVGLGPVRASVNTTPYGSNDGESYRGSSVGKRNIVMTLGLNPDWSDQSMSSLRQFLYGYFIPKQQIKLRFYDDVMPVCEIYGYVESFEPNMFKKDPEVQVSIICPEPDFIGTVAHVVNGSVVDGAGSVVINYTGTVPTGFILEVLSHASQPAYTGDLMVENRTLIVPSPGFKIAALSLSDITVDTTKKLKLSSVRGEKYIQSVSVPGGVITNILKKLDPLSAWPQLEPTQNVFRVVGEDAGQTWTLTYYDRFGGL